jgi:hypothetical protein
MALKKNLTLVNNFGEDSLFPNAYIRVMQVSGTKRNCNAVVHFCKSADSNVLQFKEYSFNVDLDGGNFIKQAYDYLKTLPEFAGASDC